MCVCIYAYVHTYICIYIYIYVYIHIYAYGRKGLFNGCYGFISAKDRCKGLISSYSALLAATLLGHKIFNMALSAEESHLVPPHTRHNTCTKMWGVQGVGRKV